MKKGNKHIPVKKKNRPGASAGRGGVLVSTTPMKSRTQIYNPRSRKWIKRDEKTGMFCAVKKDGEPWRRVPVEEHTPVMIAGW
jgi:hypothetical protein